MGDIQNTDQTPIMICDRCGKESDELYKYEVELICLGCLADNFYKVLVENYFDEKEETSNE